jgi:hypothetical protein
VLVDDEWIVDEMRLLGDGQRCECESEHQNGHGDANPKQLMDIGADKRPRHSYSSIIPRQRCDHACSHSKGLIVDKKAKCAHMEFLKPWFTERVALFQIVSTRGRPRLFHFCWGGEIFL